MLTFNFTVDEANYLLNALGARPFAEVSGLINNIQGQAAPQLAALNMPPVAEEPEEETP
jgi:hypothetical protein